MITLNKMWRGLKVLKNNDLKAHKCPIDSADMPAAVQTIVKVQPNNFLLDRTKSNSHSSSLIDLHQNPKNDSPQSKPNIHPGNAMNTEIKTYQDMSYTNLNDNLKVSTVKSVQHHQLCDQSAPSYELESALEKADMLKKMYCSMRMQTGTRNILLDNAHNNIAPVLYTRSHKIKHGEVLKTHEIASMVNSLSSNECKINSMHQLQIRSQVMNAKINSMVSETSTQNQQRVAEWIQSNIDNEISSSDNSRAESVKNKKYIPIDKVKYAEMEENVKKFLFG
ncbi:hypothetical protein NQ317_002920 [Molorchus minor]|uniref:Uncharacterized protein n=1 Tax=Molorchus minor TaxID=1323400 RepID=A0ABQ9J6R0_9CUCU|nr:hypothetical protein NQ317_002920 [Molorchus minor]